MLVIFLAVFCCEFAAALVLLKTLIPLAKRLGYVDRPNERKIHKNPVPYGGGVAVFLTLALMSAVYLAGYHLRLFDKAVSPINWSMLGADKRVLAMAVGGVGMFAIGLFDDIKDLRPRHKLLCQIAVALVVSPWTPRMSFLSSYPLLDQAVTCFWIVLVTNAFNLLDNMDGLCASVALVSLAVHLCLLHAGGQHLVAFLTVILAAPMAAFLVFNAPPARVFLGDAGSLLVGYAMAELSILSTYYREGTHLASFFMPLLILAIPLYDVATVMGIRFSRGAPLFKADRNHFSHRLLGLGLSSWGTLFTIVSISLAMGMGALLLVHATDREAALVFAQAVLIFMVILLLEYAGAKKSRVG